MIVAVPTVPPVTTPVVEPTAAIVDALELHVPPVVASVRLIVNPEHTIEGPVIAVGIPKKVRFFVT